MSIYLRAFEPGDLELINKWHNDDEINSLTTGRKYFVSSEYDKKWLLDKMLDNKSQVYCAICEEVSKKMIGYTGLTEIDYLNRKAFWAGLVIGDKSSRSKGYATSTSIKILSYGFYELGLNKIWGYWLDDHKTAQFTTGLMLGFVKEGLLREEVFKGNKFHDVFIMSLLKVDFEKYKLNSK
jgi:ribosomal-protein-alanine N-acetyltransferase